MQLEEEKRKREGIDEEGKCDSHLLSTLFPLLKPVTLFHGTCAPYSRSAATAFSNSDGYVHRANDTD